MQITFKRNFQYGPHEAKRGETRLDFPQFVADLAIAHGAAVAGAEAPPEKKPAKK